MSVENSEPGPSPRQLGLLQEARRWARNRAIPTLCVGIASDVRLSRLDIVTRSSCLAYLTVLAMVLARIFHDDTNQIC